MRDPKRIKITLRAIEIIWEKYPDMRLGQLLLNAGMTYNTEENVLVQKLMDAYVLGNVEED